MKKKIESMYRLHYQQLYRIAYSILKNHSDAEDVVSEGFLIFLEKCERVDPEKALNWLYVVISNKAKEYYRVNHRSMPFDYSGELGSEAETLLFGEHDESVEALIFQRDLKQQVNALISNNLNELQVNCVKSYYFEGLSYQEISEKYGVNIGTVRSNLSRSRQKLKDVVEKEQEIRNYID